MILNPRQRKVVEAKENNILCLASAGSGKCQPNSLVIPTPQGNKKVGEIKVGDYLFDRHGKPTKVLGVYPQGEKEVYEITFEDKRKTLCCNEHIWNVHCSNWRDDNDFRNFTLQEIIDKGYERIDKRGYKKHIFSIPCAAPVEYSLHTPTVDPYLFGLFLGDGSCREKALTISSSDIEIVNSIKDIIKAEAIYKDPAKNYSWTFYKNYEKRAKIWTLDILKDYKDAICCYSYEKYIPDDFKYTSIENRLSLIQGLMDTDGSICYNEGRYNVSYSTTSTRLKDDFIEIMDSLGYVCSCKIDKREEKYTTGQVYEVSVNIPNSEKYKLFRLSRKKNLALQGFEKKQHRKYDRTTIQEIKKLNYKEEMTCFYVDNPEHLYLTNRFLVTHNTTVLTERIRRILKEGCNPENIIAISFTNMAADEMKKRLGDIANGMFIGTIHSLANSLCIANGIDTSQYIIDADFDKIIFHALSISKDKYPHVKHLLIDEFQDICPRDFQFIEKISTENFFAIGDERQMIYQFRGSSDAYLRNMYYDENCKKYYLNINYRCAPNIIDFADSLLYTMKKLSPKAIAAKIEDGYVNDDCTFDEALDELEYYKDWGNWFVLCRTNNELATAATLLEERAIPYISFKKGDLDLIEMEALLKDNRVKLLTIHTAKGLESKHVIVTGAQTWNEEERKIAYVAATRAEQSLYWTPSICHRTKRPKNRDIANAGRAFDKVRGEMISFE